MILHHYLLSSYCCDEAIFEKQRAKLQCQDSTLWLVGSVYSSTRRRKLAETWSTVHEIRKHEVGSSSPQRAKKIS